MNDATKKSAPTGNSAEVQNKRQQQKGKSKTLIALLLEAIKLATNAYQALVMIDTRFNEDERDGLVKLRRFAKRHAQAVIAGTPSDGESIRRTTRLAEKVGTALDNRFEAIMRDSFVIFDKGMANIRSAAPEIFVRDGNKILALQEALRHELDSEIPTYEATVEAYKAMMAYIPSVSAEAEQAAKVERDRLRLERDKGFAQEVLDELSALDEL